jgi:hypothetical protein
MTLGTVSSWLSAADAEPGKNADGIAQTEL